MIFLLSDAAAYLYDGCPGSSARLIVVLSNLIVFTLVEVQLFFFNLYITYTFMETGRFRKLPKLLLIGFILPCVAVSLVIVSQFTGLYYTFDANNLYHRGPLYPLCLVFPAVIMIVQSIFVIRNKSYVRKNKNLSIILTMIFLLIAGIMQMFNTGIAFNDYAAFLGCLNMFLLSLYDQNEILLMSANTDVPTGLPNTYGYLAEADKIAATKDLTKYNAYYFDIVRMGRLDSIYGKSIGDEIIAKYSKFIKSKIGKDEVVARLGGDFFVALILREHTDAFLKLLSDVPVVIKNQHGQIETLHLSAVAGILEFAQRKANPGIYISAPAEALYYAKNVYKKPYVFYDDELKKEIDERRMLEEALSHAIDDKEFIAYYQPKVSTNSSQLSGAEALVRWKHEGEIIPPLKFIPILEKNEKICQVDFWVLNQVCLDLRRWLEDGFTPVPVSVNFSRRHLGNHHLADDIVAVIERNDIPKNLIEIEITETIDEYTIQTLKEFVESLQAKGVRVSIDDFGTGSSSLNLIHQIHFDVLKVDRALVDIQNETGRTLLARTVELAQLLKMEVIAEGVETQDQVEFLKKINCPEIQGYFFDKPLEKKEFEKRLIKRYY